MGKKVNILLSVYNPKEEYLIEQLKSIDQQTYENIELLIFDDCITKRCDYQIFEKTLKNIGYRILPCKKENLGYTKAFEYLVEQADGDYIAFCDQDDVWNKTKIEKCVRCMEEEKTILVVTDRRIIDADGQVTCTSVRHTSKKKYNTWNSHEDIGVYNFFTACAPEIRMVMNSKFAKECIPFSKNTDHDKWIIACACACGEISYLDETLVPYRRYGENVSGVLIGIDSKKDYIEQRVLPHLKLVKEFTRRYPQYPGNGIALRFVTARMNGNVLELLKYYSIAPELVKFEIFIALMLNKIIEIGIGILKKMNGGK